MKLVPLVDRSILKPVSLSALSFQPRLIWLVDAAVAVRFVGAVGAVWVGGSVGSVDVLPAAGGRGSASQAIAFLSQPGRY